MRMSPSLLALAPLAGPRPPSPAAHLFLSSASIFPLPSISHLSTQASRLWHGALSQLSPSFLPPTRLHFSSSTGASSPPLLAPDVQDLDESGEEYILNGELIFNPIAAFSDSTASAVTIPASSKADEEDDGWVPFIRAWLTEYLEGQQSKVEGDGEGEESLPGMGDAGLPGWVDPRERGGKMLDVVAPGKGEPLNVIISGHSDPSVLSEAGLRNYVRAIGFSFECLNLHRGKRQTADLGDGFGPRDEQFLYRQTHFPGAPGRWVGSCWESLYGGNHFRAWKQNGTEANTGAWFLAVSKEEYLGKSHMIVDDGYNIGRDLLVAAALRGGKWKAWRWTAEVEWVDGLIMPGKHGINHGIEQDGLVAVLTVDRSISLPWGRVLEEGTSMWGRLKEWAKACGPWR